ncbi:MAG: T9SS type A sorting domain-containing protein [Candidatus Cloacimonadota bacterium]
MRKIVFMSLGLLWLASLTALEVFTETFNTSSTPPGWHIAGTIGIGHTDPGTAKTNADFFKTENGYNYLRLTENSTWSRAWAYYTEQKFRMKGTWSLDLDIRLGKTHDGIETNIGADGLTLVFADAATVETAGVFDPAKVEGGYGQYQGAPRGGKPSIPTNGALGYHEGFRGYAFEFDHYDNEEISTEYIHWVELDNWDHSGLGLSLADDTEFYYNEGWVRARLEASNGILTFRYHWNGSTFENTHVLNTNNPLNPDAAPLYDYWAYLGIASATGGQTAFHEIRYIKLEATAATLPVTMSSFNGTVVMGNQIRLDWITQTETNVLGYRIYRGNEPDYSSARLLDTFIQATNSSQTQAYSFVDNEASEPGIYYYWLQNLDLDGQSEVFGPVRVELTGLNLNPAPPATLSTGISRVYPNPFNPDTTINYELESPQYTELMIYNLRGQLVRKLWSGQQNRGSHKLLWDGRDEQGRAGASGNYILILKAGERSFSQRMVLSK